VLTESESKITYMKTLRERVIEAREAAQLDKVGLQTEINRLFARWGLPGISHSALSQLESGDSKTMKAATVLAIGRITGYRPEYLLFGERPATRTDEETKLRDAGGTMSAAGKAEVLGLIVQWARAGETQAAIGRKVERMLVAIGKRGDR
jgi:hypothetical protein